jgi:hypothetical protein
MLFDRLTGHHNLGNLVWVWVATPPGFGPDAPGLYPDYFPGLQYADALALDLENPRMGFRRDGQLAAFGVGKAIGLGAVGFVPSPEMVGPQTKWSWFIASPDDSASPERAEALKKVYTDPRVEAR